MSEEYIQVPRRIMQARERVMLSLLGAQVAERRRSERLARAGVSVRGHCIEPLHIVLDLLCVPDVYEDFDREEVFFSKFDEMVPSNSNRRTHLRFLRWAKAETGRINALQRVLD